MNFDTHWVHFEQKHGPQSLGAKEDALFWFKKGAESEGKDIDLLKGEIEDLKHDLSVTEGELERARDSKPECEKCPELEERIDFLEKELNAAEGRNERNSEPRT